jgi:hypothetical protein
MVNSKRLSIFAILLLLSSCISIGASLAITQTSPLANNLPFDIGTPTPSPSPVPTVTPVPTPKPEPAAKPTLEINCRTTATTSNLKVEVSGFLTYNRTGINSSAVYVAFSADSGQHWENFSVAQTQADGSYSASWIPNATGNYLIRTQYMGNDSLHWMNATVSLALAPDSKGNVFSVTSNSTVSNFTYNSEMQQIAFITNGTSGGTGYVNICVPKAQANDAQALKVNMDGNPVGFGSQSKDDVWILSCSYSQSEHAFMVQIPSVQILSSAETPWIAIIIVIAVLVAVLFVAFTIRRRRRTAATVAAILKKNHQ